MMNSDKNIDVLEKQLKILGNKIRIEILKILYNSRIPIPFSRLQKDLLENYRNISNFSFHLNSLKTIELIASTSEGYSLTNMGKKITQNILSMEHVINEQKKNIMIRTSKYSKEPFNELKIEEYLVREGEMEKYLAKKIASEVKNRLFKSNIDYLTAPLMREYINVILLENGLEEVRHRLTRLGTPPHEVYKLLNSQDEGIKPNNFIRRLGSDVSEQFLLLNQLPKDLADLYISGDIALLHLNYWSLRPLGFYVDTQSIMSVVFSKKKELTGTSKKPQEIIKIIMNFIDVLLLFYPYLSGDILLGNFNKYFLSFFKDLEIENLNSYFQIFSSQLSKYYEINGDNHSHVSLDFVYDHLSNEIEKQFEIDTIFLNQLHGNLDFNCHSSKPLALFDYVNLNHSKVKTSPLFYTGNAVFYNQIPSNLINSSLIKVKHSSENDSGKNKIILDKILINLDQIAQKAHQNDGNFCEILQETMHSVFKLFSLKESLVMKKLDSIRDWHLLCSQMFKNDLKTCMHESLKSISFFGLNEAIKHHCGIELDRLDKSELFALEVVSIMRKMIEERNDFDGSQFILSQPNHHDYYLGSKKSKKIKFNDLHENYSGKIIRKDSALPLRDQIAIFKKFEEIINGGVLFSCYFNHNNGTLQEHVDTLTRAKIHAFSINCTNHDLSEDYLIDH